MGRFDPKYTQEQNEAMRRAMVDEGMSAQKACAAAKKGELGLPPFDYNESTAASNKTIWTRTRKKAEELMAGVVHPDSIIEVAESVFRDNKVRLEALTRKTKPTEKDYAERYRLLRELRELDALLRRIPPAKTQGGTRAQRQAKAEREATDPHSNGNEEGGVSELARSLLAEVERQKAAEEGGPKLVDTEAQRRVREAAQQQVSTSGQKEAGHVPSHAQGPEHQPAARH